MFRLSLGRVGNLLGGWLYAREEINNDIGVVC